MVRIRWLMMEMARLTTGVLLCLPGESTLVFPACDDIFIIEEHGELE